MKIEVRYITEDEMPLWEDLVDRSPQGCIFCRGWWIRAACGANFKILGCFKGDSLVAGIPLHFVRYGPVKVCGMPKLSQTWGPVLEPMEGRYVTRLSHEMELLRNLADRLWRIPIFFQCFHYTLPNWLPFYWAGFRQTTVFTYILDNISDEEKLWAGMRKSVRAKVRKAEAEGIKIVSGEPSDVLGLCGATFRRQRMRLPFSRELFRSLVYAARAHNAGNCFVATDRHGRKHAATFLVWDRNRAYALAGGADTRLRSSGAKSLLLWELIRFAAEHVASFDFEGSNLQHVEPFIRAFGARQQPFNRIIKAPLVGRIVLTAIGKL